MRNPMPIFTVVTLTAPVLIAVGAVLGGIWAVSAVIWMTVLTGVMDRLITATLGSVEGDEFPAADRLSVALALAHFGTWLLVVAALSGWTGLTSLEKLLVFAGAGLFMGQVSNSNAHELIHKNGRGLRRLGRWVYISVLFGHHLSAHTLVHHVHVGTPRDPSTARLGEGFYRYLKRAWIGGFRQGLRAETTRFARLERSWWHHPYVSYIGGAVGVLALAALIGGPKGAFAAVCLSGFAQTQLLLSDYVQHYGLSRQVLSSGKHEPVGLRHSWNAPQPMSSALMLNAPRHSDHHASPSRPFPALRLSGDMPMLPRSLPVMACLALYPAQWRRVMDPRAAAWQHPAR